MLLSIITGVSANGTNNSIRKSSNSQSCLLTRDVCTCFFFFKWSHWTFVRSSFVLLTYRSIVDNNDEYKLAGCKRQLVQPIANFICSTVVHHDYSRPNLWHYFKATRTGRPRWAYVLLWFFSICGTLLHSPYRRACWPTHDQHCAYCVG